MKTLITCLLVAGVAQGARAQTVSFGARLGGNLATATFNSLEELSSTGLAVSYKKSSILAPQLGLVMNMQWNNWAFQPALLFSQKGVKQSASADFSSSGDTAHEDFTVTSRVNYLELPLNVVYTIGGDHGFQLFAGPYLAVGVGGKATYSDNASYSSGGVTQSYSESGSAGYSFGSEFAEPSTPSSGGSGSGSSTEIIATVRRFDAGVTGGVGYRMGPVQAQLGYSLGLFNAQPNYPASYQTANTTGYHRSLQLTATYFFPGK